MDEEHAGFDVAGFFGALGSTTAANQDSVKSYLASAFVDADMSQPIPRAKAFVESGEWEGKDGNLFLLEASLLDQACRASVGTKNSFCVLDALSKGGTCATGTHVRQADVAPGWCILSSGAGSGTPAGGLLLGEGADPEQLACHPICCQDLLLICQGFGARHWTKLIR